MTPTEFISNIGFLQGVASTLDIGGRLNVYEIPENSQKNDCEALAADWNVVGQELEKAIQICEQIL